MKKMLFVQIAMVWLIVAVTMFDVTKRKSTVAVAAELFSLLASIALLIKFWVLKRGNDNILMIKARDLSITWSDNPVYWSWLPLPSEKTNEILDETAVLKKVCWLDVSGKFNTHNLSLGTTYEVVFIVKLEDTAYGWDWEPVKLKLIMPNGTETTEQSVNFVEHIGKQWINVLAGDFIMSKDNIGEINFSLYEHEANMWRSGLIVKGVVIRKIKHRV